MGDYWIVACEGMGEKRFEVRRKLRSMKCVPIQSSLWLVRESVDEIRAQVQEWKDEGFEIHMWPVRMNETQAAFFPCIKGVNEMTTCERKQKKKMTRAEALEAYRKAIAPAEEVYMKARATALEAYWEACEEADE